ncbi:histidine triad nucleotide-binding protein [Desulforegula conservatrix]|uniref:histidine triad nucleotide-binding protein n=1 Tax=Desulforegula conservatrix TaxID=153026 RepID=UPI00040CDE9A|nr:histidine triad nucleotide-binding protein [Desulforegula conservatrix]
MSENCIFCKIVNKEIPSELIYEDEKLIVFKDIRPQAPVHLLIVPRKHIRSINDLKPEDHAIAGDMLIAAQKIAKLVGVDKNGYKLNFHVEKGGGQEVFHLHMHLVGGWEK